jgi:hypothetical protein
LESVTIIIIELDAIVFVLDNSAIGCMQALAFCSLLKFENLHNLFRPPKYPTLEGGTVAATPWKHYSQQ